MALPTPIRRDPDKKPGVRYVTSDDGVELPVIDVTHPAFREPSASELAAEEASFVRDARRRERMPAFVERLVLKLLLRKSVLARALTDAEKAFLPGLPTYLFKLGPDLLGDHYAHPIDRKIAASLPALSMRLRLLDMARLLAEGLTPILAARRSPLHFVNLGGGPSADSWNALLLLQRDGADLLDERAIRVHVLDGDGAGPAFGARAIDALREPGGPLAGLDVALLPTPYDWTKPERLRAVFDAIGEGDPIVAVSSEGALFEYADDAIVAANLEALRALTLPDAIVVGSVTSDGEIANLLHRSSKVPIRPRSEAAFAALARRAGWQVERTIVRPTCRDVRLVKA